MTAPLEGVRVVEIASYVAAPAAGALLTDLGAEVVKVEIPAGATVLEFPQGHAYPGLIDALSTAFGDKPSSSGQPTGVLADKAADAGTEIYPGLDPTERQSRELVRWGVTTAYVSNRADSTWRGIVALVHPQRDGMQPARQRPESIHGNNAFCLVHIVPNSSACTDIRPASRAVRRAPNGGAQSAYWPGVPRLRLHAG